MLLYVSMYVICTYLKRANRAQSHHILKPSLNCCYQGTVFQYIFSSQTDNVILLLITQENS